MRILVTGGRQFNDAQMVAEALSQVIGDTPHTDVIIIHGDATGADHLADVWAHQNNIQVARCPAPWKKWPLSAGTMRNKAMLLLEPDIVVSFPGGAGTAHMRNTARKAGIKVIP